MWSAGGEQPYGAWLNERYVLRMKAGSNYDTAGANFWLPLPKQKGPYVVQVKLTRDARMLVFQDMSSFK